MSGAVRINLDGLLGVEATPVVSASEGPPPPGLAGPGGGFAHDGARTRDALASWDAKIRSADAEIIPEKRKLDARTRDTLRNDAYVAGGSQIYKDSIVGAVFKLNAKPNSLVLFGKPDLVWEREFSAEVEAKFMLAANSQSHWFDYSEVGTFTEQVRLGVGCFIAGGEILATAEWLHPDRYARPFGTCIQMVDTDRLSNPLDGRNDPRIRGGIERNDRGAPVAYWIRNTHPAEGQFQDYRRIDNARWTRVPRKKRWGRPQVLHVYDCLRPGQTRGVAAIASALTEMRMTKHLRQTELERVVVAASYAASLETELPPAEAFAAMGGGEPNPNAVFDYAQNYLDMVDAYSGGGRNLHVAGTRVPLLPAGTHLKLHNPGATSPQGDKFEQSLLRYIAATLGISYEQLSRDYTQTNYSSARAAMGETRKAMQSRKVIAADATANFVYRLWLEEMLESGEIETAKRRGSASFYEGMNADAYSSAEWLGAGEGQIDPLKETQAAELRLKIGLSTREIEVARLTGQDWRAIDQQRSVELENEKSLKLPSVHEKDEPASAAKPTAAPQEDDE